MYFLLSMAGWASDYAVSPSDDVASYVGGLQPGDSLTFTPGTYTIDSVWEWSLSGTAGSPISIKAQDGAVLSISTSASAGISLTNSTWVRFDGLTIQGATGWGDGSASFSGVYIEAGEDISLQNMSISNIPGTAVRVTGESERVSVQDSKISNIKGGSAIEMGCSDVSCWSENARISHNWIYNISGENEHAIHLHHGSQGAYLTDNVIYSIEAGAIYLGSNENGSMNVADANAVWNSRYGIMIRGAAKLNNNLVFNTSDVGIHIDDPDRDSYDQIIISFNSIVNTGNWGIWADDWFSVEGNVIANNAICSPVGKAVKLVGYEPEEDDTGSVPLEGHSGHYITNNLLCGLTDGLYDYEGHYLIGRGYIDFLDYELWNFYPSMDSLLLDAANPSGNTYIPTYDFNGIERTGGSLEIGAYEWDGESNPGWPVQEGFKSFELTYEDPPPAYIGGCCEDEEGKEGQANEGGEALLLPLLLLGGALRRRQRGGIG